MKETRELQNCSVGECIPMCGVLYAWTLAYAPATSGELIAVSKSFHKCLKDELTWSCVWWLYINTVKLVYKDHSRDQPNVVLHIHRWSLYTGSISCKVYCWGPIKCGLYKEVVIIYRWPLDQV